ncbi:MAG: hypothetical protein ACJ75J_18375 [Cytophagaceae bacterium]|jgi:hypothetical protein
MKVLFLKNFNGWGKGSVARLINEMAQEYIDRGFCALADPAAPEFRCPVVEEELVKSAEVTAQSYRHQEEILSEESTTKEDKKPKKL